MSVAFKRSITDHEIETYLLIKQELNGAKKFLEKVKEDMQACEEKIIRNLELGITVESDRYDLDVKEFERRFPAWKEHFISYQGKAEADKILEETEPKQYRNLVIKEK